MKLSTFAVDELYHLNISKWGGSSEYMKEKKNQKTTTNKQKPTNQLNKHNRKLL